MSTMNLIGLFQADHTPSNFLNAASTNFTWSILECLLSYVVSIWVLEAVFTSQNTGFENLFLVCDVSDISNKYKVKYKSHYKITIKAIYTHYKSNMLKDTLIFFSFLGEKGDLSKILWTIKLPKFVWILMFPSK